MPRSKLIFAWIAAAIGVAAAISLGNWQTRRGDAKLLLQAQADAAERAAPLEIAATPSSIESVAAGFAAQGSRHWGVRSDGHDLPGQSDAGRRRRLLRHHAADIGQGLPAVLIDRGWKARSAGEGANPAAPPTGQVTVEGLAVARPSTLLELGRAPKLEVPGIWQNLDYDAYEKVTKRSVARFVVRQAGAARDRCDR